MAERSLGEHLQAAVRGLLDAAMASCPDLRVVATSRRLLDLAGERVWPFPTLSLPPDGASPAEIDRSEAVRLFVDRARLRLPGFRLEGRLRSPSPLSLRRSHGDGACIPVAMMRRNGRRR
jgi:predicted ATPase